MSGGGIENIVFEHRVAHDGAEHDAVAAKDRHVELCIVRDKRPGRVGKDARKDANEGAGVRKREAGRRLLFGGGKKIVRRHGGAIRGRIRVRRHGDIPCLPLRRREAHAHEPRALRVHRSRLGVEPHERGLLQFRRQCAGVLGAGHEAIVVREVGQRLQRLFGRTKRLGRRIDLEKLRQAVQLELGAGRRQLRGVGRTADQRFQVQIKRNIGADGREELGHLRILGTGGHLLGQLALQLGSVRNDILHRAVVGQQLGSGLFAHALDAGNVVRRVARQRKIVDHLPGRCEMPMRLHLLLVVDFGGGVLAVAGTEEVDVRGNELGGILVRRGAIHFESSGGGLDGQRAHDVVRLVAVLPNDGDVERFRQFEGVRDRGGQILGHLLAVGLVGRIGLVAERGAARIHRQHGVRGCVILKNGNDAVHESDEGGGVDAGGGHARVLQEHEVPPIEKRHEIDDEQLFHGQVLVFSSSRDSSFTTASHALRPPDVPPSATIQTVPFGTYFSPGANVAGAKGVKTASGCCIRPSCDVL